MRMCLYDSFTSRKMVFDNGVGGGGWMGVGDEFYVFFIYINRQRYRIFLFPRKSSFLRIFEEYRMNEWKSCFFLFPGCFFFPPQKIEWMNDPEWPSNFSAEKKKNKKTHKNPGKKNTSNFYKKSELDQNLIEWQMNFSAGNKKSKLIFFPTHPYIFRWFKRMNPSITQNIFEEWAF